MTNSNHPEQAAAHQVASRKQLDEQIEAIASRRTFTDQDNGRIYTNEGYLGMGGFGIVLKVVSEPERHQAMKVPKPSIKARAVRREIEMLTAAGKHERLVDFQGDINTEIGTCLLFELLLPKSLAALMAGRGTLTEPEVRWFIPQIAEGIQHLNSKGLAHRDIKPANIFLAADMTPRLGDLGLSRKLSPGEAKCSGLVGTPFFRAPELFVKGAIHTFKMDVFSLGVITYMMLIGFNPELTDRTKANKYRLAAILDDPTLTELSALLLGRLLDFDPRKRMDVAEIKDDAFFTSGVCPTELSQDVFEEAPTFAILGKHSRDLVCHDGNDDNGPAEPAEPVKPAEPAESEERHDPKKLRLQPLATTVSPDRDEALSGKEGEYGSPGVKEGAQEKISAPVSKKSGVVVEAVPVEVNNVTEQPLHKVTAAAEVSERQDREYEEQNRAEKEAIRAQFAAASDEYVDMAVLAYSSTPETGGHLNL